MKTNEMLAHIDRAKSMSPENFFFRSGVNQIDICGDVIESSYEFFRPAVSVYENGDLLFSEDARSVDNYHNEVYTKGRFTSEKDAIDYLSDKYEFVTDWEAMDTRAPYVKNDYPVVWKNPKYAKQQEAKQNKTYEQTLERIVFRDLGVQKVKNGQSYHIVDFAYACDQRTFGQDNSLPNSYLVTTKRKTSDGKIATSHAYFLSDDIYQRLMKYANTTGMNNSRWTGVVAAKVEYPVVRDGQHRVGVNLTRAAEKSGDIMKPKVPFDVKKHDSFVKASLSEFHRKRENMVARKLPDMDIKSETYYDVSKK